MRELLQVPGLAPAPYEYAARACGLVFTAGACPLDDDGDTVAPGDFGAQATRVVENLRVVLAAAGATFEDVLKTTIYVASSERADLVTVWNVVRDAFGERVPPSTLLGVAVLGYPEQLCEVEAVAAV